MIHWLSCFDDKESFFPYQTFLSFHVLQVLFTLYLPDSLFVLLLQHKKLPKDPSEHHQAAEGETSKCETKEHSVDTLSLQKGYPR